MVTTRTAAARMRSKWINKWIVRMIAATRLSCQPDNGQRDLCRVTAMGGEEIRTVPAVCPRFTSMPVDLP